MKLKRKLKPRKPARKVDAVQAIKTEGSSELQNSFAGTVFYADVVVITPKQAFEWLLNSRKLGILTGDRLNRPIDWDQVQAVALAVCQNDFPASDDAIMIALSPIGRVVLNGQHRLTAIVQSNQSVFTKVYFDYPLSEDETADGDFPFGEEEAEWPK